jgi:hypothetical protein
MKRFWKSVLFLFGVFLFGITVLRWIQPAQTEGLYLTIYGSRYGLTCCATYMIDEDKRRASRVRVGSTRQPSDHNPVSPDGEWMYARTRLSRSWAMYLIPLNGGEIIKLPDEVADGNSFFWSLEEGTQKLYYSRSIPGESQAYYRVTPVEHNPVQLTDPMFDFVRATYQEGLPYTTFSPWIPLFYSMLVLFAAGSLSYWRRSPYL